MLKFVFIFFICFTVSLLSASYAVKDVTVFDNGRSNEYSVQQHPVSAGVMSQRIRDERISLVWQASDATAISHDVKVSAATGQSFGGWYLNNYRVSLYQDNALPLWENMMTASYEYPMDMTECGSYLAAGDEYILKVFSASSSTPIWQYTAEGQIVELQFNSDGSGIFMAEYNSTMQYSLISYFEIGNDQPVWTAPFQGSAGNLVLSGDDSVLIFTQYGTISAMWVMDASDGTIIFEGPEYNQNPPAISDDGLLIVNGDYSGYVYLYEYDNDLGTYSEKWNYRVGGGSAWIGGMAISGDGSTIAVGTMIFLTNNYDGEIYLFNSYMPEPVWIYEGVGDYVIDVDLSYTGSVLAAASWGPIGNATSDFFFFRRESNIPMFELNTPGSLFALDLASDGSFCTTGGKAVHAREFGNGGSIYNIDCDLGGGFISGQVNLADSEDNSGAKVYLPDLDSYYAYSNEQGYFQVNNVPEGFYYAEITKIGYYTGIVPDIVVLENETVDIGEITLQPAGTAPSYLYATQAAGLTVELEWEALPERDLLGYNIYRKIYEQAPYPESPLSFVSPDENTFIDNTALPFVEYKYVVTALLEENLQSPYSPEATGWISTGFYADQISVYTGTTPSIDGIIAPGEWDDAFQIDCSDFWGSYDNTINPIGSVIGYYKINPAGDELYIAYINYNDSVLEDHDEVALYIDDNNDGSFPSIGDNSEGNYWAAYYASGNQISYRPIYNTGGVGDVIYLDNPQLEVSSDSGCLVYEFMLPVGEADWEITPGPENKSGIGLFVLDDNTPDPHGFDGWWPYDNLDIFSPEGYGQICFGTEPGTPSPPENITITEQMAKLVISWDMPPMNDFSHFNIFYSMDQDRDFEYLDSTVGTSYYYLPEFEGYYEFYLTTVNLSGLESDPSETVSYSYTDTEDLQIVTLTALQGNYPNPFNPTTRICFSLAESEKVSLQIYNIKGQKVRTLIDETLPFGSHNVLWDGKDDYTKSVSSGIYLYRLQTEDKHFCRKMILLR